MSKEKIYTFYLKRKELVAVICGFFITYVMVFLLGVEVGKSLFSTVKPVKEVVQVTKKEPLTVPVVEKKSEKVNVPVVKKKNLAPVRIYIQAAAFSKKKSADRLSERLKKRGYRTEIRFVGGFYKVIIGPYPSVEAAKKDLIKLKRDEEIFGYIIKL